MEEIKRDGPFVIKLWEILYIYSLYFQKYFFIFGSTGAQNVGKRFCQIHKSFNVVYVYKMHCTYRTCS